MLNRLQNCRKTAVVLKLFDVIDAIAARQVQKNSRKHHLDIEPALAAGRPNMSPDRRADTAGLDQLDIHRKTRQRRQSMARRITSNSHFEDFVMAAVTAGERMPRL